MITRYKAADPSDPTSKAEYKVLAAGAQRYWHGTRAAYEQVKDSIPNNTMICITDDNDAPSDIAPLGSVFAYYGSTSPDGYLICDGSTFDTSKYPDLYLFLGSDTLPDLRECTLVGAGQSTRAILDETGHSHDVYNVGEFKDDQIQNITGTVGGIAAAYAYPNGAFYRDSGNENYKMGGATGNNAAIKLDASRVARTGTTTHGKQVGVNYIIKAVSNMNKSDASALLAQMAQHIRNQNILSDYEDITISTDSANPTVMQYDGFIYVSTRYLANLNINTAYLPISDHVDISGGGACMVAVRKGDRVYIDISTSNTLTEKVAYYKLRDYTGR